MIFIVLVLGFLLRVIRLDQSLWLDESISVLAAKELPFWQYVTSYPIGDFHPPGYFGILWIWGRLFGFSEISVRMPSVILGVATIYLSYLLASRLFDKKVALYTTLLLTTAPLHVYYSQEARMYSFAAFAAVFSFLAFYNFINSSKINNLIVYTMSIVILLYSDYVTYLILPAQFLYLIFFYRNKIKQFILASVLSGLFFAPWLLIFPAQLQNGIQTAKDVPGWKAVVGDNSIKSILLVWVKTLIGRISFDNKQLYTGIVGFLSLGYLLALIKVIDKIDRKVYLLILWIAIPLLLAFSISFLTPILSYFRMLFIIPAFYILVAYGLTKYSHKLSFYLFILLICFNLIAVGLYFTNPNYQREDWKGAAKFLSQNANAQTITLFENNNLPAPYRYYQDTKVTADGALENFPANTKKDLKPIAKLVEDKNKVYLVEYLVDISDSKRLVQKELVNLNFKLKSTRNFNGVGFIYEYVR